MSMVLLDGSQGSLCTGRNSQSEQLIIYLQTFDEMLIILVHVFDAAGQYRETRVHDTGRASREFKGKGTEIVATLDTFLRGIAGWHASPINVLPFADDVRGRKFGIVVAPHGHVQLPVGLEIEPQSGACSMRLT